MKPEKILFIATSHDKMGDSNRKTGIWLEELATAYYTFKEAGAEITIATPLGGGVPIDPQSLSILIITRSAKRFLKDTEAMNFLSQSVGLEGLISANFDAVLLIGGHGAIWDFADNSLLTQLLENFNKEDKPIGAVSHGVAGLLTIKNDKGELLVNGRKLTCCSNSEEESAGVTSLVPFLLETRLSSAGGRYSKGTDYVSYVVADGNMITGQNPASAEEASRKIIAALASVSRKEASFYNLAINN